MDEKQTSTPTLLQDRERLRREVLAGLDGIERLVNEEQKRQSLESGGDAARTLSDPERQEVVRLKAQMDELYKRFTNLCARFDSQTTGRSPSGDFKSGLRPRVPPEPPLIRKVGSLPPVVRERSLPQRQAAKKAGLRNVLVVGTILVAGSIAWFRFGFQHRELGEVAIETEPSHADVYLDDQFRGQTPLQLTSIQAGSHAVRITKEGYEPLTRELRVNRGETAHVDGRLNELSAAELQVLARSLYDQGKLREADRICTLLYQKPPYDVFALDLKEKILTRLLAGISTEERQSHSSIAGSLSPQSETKLPRGAPPSPGPERNTPVSKTPPVTGTSQPTRRPASTDPVNARLPHYNPKPTPAMTNNPNETTLRATPDARQSDRGSPEVVELIKHNIQARNLTEARALLQQLPEKSQEAVELRNLIQVAESEGRRQQSFVSSALQKAESALIVAHYVSPPDDNVVLHCNRGLSLDPQNQRLLTLKKEVINRSIDQARDWIRRLKFEQASAALDTLNRLAQSDNGFPVRRDWFQEELKNLEFTSYPVSHEHKLGTCGGRLRMNAYALSFVPSGDSVHGFTESLRNIVVTQGGEELKIRVSGKTYQFRLNRDTFQGVYERLMNLVAKATQ